MKLPLAFLLLAGGAVFALGDDNPDFPKSQVKSAQGYDAGSDFTAGSGFTNTYQQPNQDGSAAQANGGEAQRHGDTQGSGQNGSGQTAQQTGNSGGKQRAGVMQGSDGKKGYSDKSNGRDESGKDDMGPNGSREEDESGGEDREAPMTLDEARSNFAAVVESYVAKKSAKGYWAYVPKKGGKPRRLVRPSVDDGSIHPKEGQRFSGVVTLEDVRGGKPLALSFDVDFSGTKWKVVGVKPAAAPVSSRR